EPPGPLGSKRDTHEQVLELQGYTAKGVYAVRQVLTWETAAVKRIDQVAFGTASGSEWAHSHRTAARALKPLKEVPAEKKEAPPEESKPGMPKLGGPESGGSKLPVGGFPGGPGGDLTSTTLTPNGLVRDRYLDVTPQARRIPVGVALIVDQLHVARVQTAF